MRHSGQSRQGKAVRGTTRAPKFLIANLELKFHLSPIRISNLNFSNRKFFAIFAAKFCTDGEPRAALSSLQAPASSFPNLIETPRLEFLPTHRQHKHLSFSNRDKTGSFLLRFSPGPRPAPSAPATHVKLGPPRITSYESPVTLLPPLASRPRHA